MYDVIVIGGGPAGLQAALTLGRLHRTILLLDSGHYRNDPASEMHNFITHDGTPPEEFRLAARKDLAAYETVEVVDDEVATVTPDGAGFAVVTSGGASYDARAVILATGVRDTLPAIPGVDDLWGSVVAHCPFCHGHEFADGVVAVQEGPHATRLAAMLSRIAKQVVVLEGAVTSVTPEGSGARVTVGETSLYVDGFFVAGEIGQAAPFAGQLGLSLLPSGCIEIDAFGHTSRPRVYAGGDLAHQAVYPMPLASVLHAAAAGAMAAMGAIQDLIAEELPAAG